MSWTRNEQCQDKAICPLLSSSSLPVQPSQKTQAKRNSKQTPPCNCLPIRVLNGSIQQEQPPIKPLRSRSYQTTIIRAKEKFIKGAYPLSLAICSFLFKAIEGTSVIRTPSLIMHTIAKPTSYVPSAYATLPQKQILSHLPPHRHNHIQDRHPRPLIILSVAPQKTPPNRRRSNITTRQPPSQLSPSPPPSCIPLPFPPQNSPPNDDLSLPCCLPFI